MVHDAGEHLLRICLLAVGRVLRQFVQADDIGRISYVIDGFGGREEAACHALVHILSFEADPIAFPARLRLRVIRVPLSGEKEEDVARFYGYVFQMGGTERAAALDDIEHLIFVQYSAFVDVEVVSVCVAGRRIGFVSLYFFVAHGTYG